MSRTAKPLRMAAPGYVPAMQAFALRTAINTLIEQHNALAGVAHTHGYGGNEPYLVLAHSAADPLRGPHP